jgi:hypothetical protein
MITHRPTTAMDHSRRIRQSRRGFALIVTISLMILLTVVAVGLLTLSSISLRALNHDTEKKTAQSNARLALMLALGELQQTLGPDRAVTATSELLHPAPAKANTLGVWESWWDFDPSQSPNYIAEKTHRFRRWLVSSANPEGATRLDFTNAPWNGRRVELVGDGSLGSNAPASAKVEAGIVPVTRGGKAGGGYAWHIVDESVKARINLYRDPSKNSSLAEKRALLAGHRPDLSLARGPDNRRLTGLPTDFTSSQFEQAQATVGKIVNLNQLDLLNPVQGNHKSFRNDLTPYSLGVLSDVRSGGLKRDLSCMFEAATLPSEFSNKKLYQSTHGITGLSDPNWSTLASYYNSYKDLISAETSPTYPVAVGTSLATPVPTSFAPAPVIAKVETIFSLVTREATASHLGIFAATAEAVKKYDYNVNLMFTPVVTLHNPYNVNLSFYSMEVEFKNVPVAFRFMLQLGGSGAWQSQSIVPENFESLNEYLQNSPNRGDKKFVIEIADWAKFDSQTPARPIVMKPGQTLVCSPFLNPQGTFWTDSRSGENSTVFDWNNQLTGNSGKMMKAKPGFTPGLGFEINCITPSSQSEENQGDAAWWMFLLRESGFKSGPPHPTDRFYVEYKVQRPRWQVGNADAQNLTSVDPSFEVTARLKTTANRRSTDYARLRFDYANDSNLKKFFNDRTYRYPPAAPKDFLIGSDAYVPAHTPISEQAGVKPFAVFSAYARTTNGGVYETGRRYKGPTDGPQLNLLKDGSLAGKPFLFHNPSRANVTMNLVTEKPSGQPYELNFQPFLSKGDYEDYMEVDGNRIPYLTGNTTTSGIKSGSYFEIPSGPLQTLADFRRSNAISTSWLPHFVQPIGNSLLHPLMSTEHVSQAGLSPYAYNFLDHSVLANHALYDGYYFSTIASRGTTQPDIVFEQFMNRTDPLPSQAFQPYLPVGSTVTRAKAQLFTAGRPNQSAYTSAAEYQMIRGPFNVNSTRVQAWKAMLAAMNKGELATLWARTSELELMISEGVPIAAMSLLNGGASRSATINPEKVDNAKSNDWNGYRELDEEELENLAIKIVAQVRERGPFLSMSEFVNRQVGPQGPRSLSGALEAAITEAEINEPKTAQFPNTFLAQVPIEAADLNDPKIYNYSTKDATTGNPAAGAPGWVSQGDLLRILEPAATVRGDTFVVRVCGEAWNPDGTVRARAYAEALVQRIPDYLNPVDPPSLNAYQDPSVSKVNQVFGRRFEVVSFRWLSHPEI